MNYNYEVINNIEGEITKAYSDKFIIKDTIIYCDNEYKEGDYVIVKGRGVKLENNRIFNLFNYKKYLLSIGIKHKIYADSTLKIDKEIKLRYKIKNSIMNILNKRKTSDYLYTFILGNKNYLDSEIKDSYKINGISHLFSISGMHVSLLTFLILYILNKIKKTNFNYILVILFLLFFVFLTDYSKSVIRAVSLYILIILNKRLKLNISTVKLIIYILLINLLINPYNIHNTGFIFSYVISIYLILFNKIIARHNNYFIKLLVTSIISFLVSIPILINNYFSINVLTTINNVIFIPFVSIIIFPLCIINLFIDIDFILLFLINVLEHLSIIATNFSITLILSKMNTFFTIFYYFLITLILYKMYKRKYLYVSLIVIVLLIHSNINYILKPTFITFIDVGQGDSILLSLNNNNILIDTGGNINYDLSINIVDYLKSEGIKKIDYLILTHSDFDHSGAAINLVNRFNVKNVVLNCGATSDKEKELIKVLDNKNITYYKCVKKIDDLYFLNTKEYNNENDNSSVIYTEIKGYKFMFMGDAGIIKENDILQKYNISNIDVLKIGHHGSKTSSGKEFINEINPKYSIISVGKNNRYGHPNREVLNNLSDSKIYRTDQDGSIMFKIKNNKLKIETCSP